MLGSALVELLERRRQDQEEPFEAFSRAELDVCDTAALSSRVSDLRPHTIYNAAAYTDVDGCEDRRDYALEVNGFAVGRLAKLAAQVGSQLVHVSSDYVFDGNADTPYREDDPTKPCSVYGESKELGEREALREPTSLVVRASWLFGPGGKNFAVTIANLAKDEDELRVVNDQRGAPTYTPFLAQALIALAESKQTGLWHYRNQEDATWFDFACAIVEVWGETCEVVPVTTEEFPRKAARPSYSVLDISRFESLLGRSKSWRNGLLDYRNRLEGELAR